jgi:hypothetical protein
VKFDHSPGQFFLYISRAQGRQPAVDVVPVFKSWEIICKNSHSLPSPAGWGRCHVVPRACLHHNTRCRLRLEDLHYSIAGGRGGELHDEGR